MQLVARPSDKHPGGASFVNGHTMNVVTRSRYGRKAIGNATRDVPQAKNLTTPTSQLHYFSGFDVLSVDNIAFL